MHIKSKTRVTSKLVLYDRQQSSLVYNPIWTWMNSGPLCVTLRSLSLGAECGDVGMWRASTSAFCMHHEDQSIRRHPLNILGKDGEFAERLSQVCHRGTHFQGKPILYIFGGHVRRKVLSTNFIHFHFAYCGAESCGSLFLSSPP